MWQFSDNGTASGIKGPVDLDLFNGTLLELKNMLLNKSFCCFFVFNF